MRTAAQGSIPMFDLRPALRRAGPAIRTRLAALHRSGHYILGEQVAAFEHELAEAFGARLAVGCGSGTSALELCLRAAGITHPGDQVIVPANTSLFTVQAVLAAGASVRLADVDGSTLLLTRETAEVALTGAVRAVIAVHLFGRAAPVDELAELCQARGLVLIQDCCQAHGLRLEGRPLTDFSPYTAYSFYPTKNLGCLGDGGAVLTNSEETAERLRLLRDGGRAGDQRARIPAVNSRLDEMHACYLRAFLPELAHWTEHRRRVAAVYEEELAGGRCYRTIPYEPEAVHHLQVMRGCRRDELRTRLAAAGIATGVHYPVPLHLHEGFTGRLSMAEPPRQATQAANEIVSLPVGPHIGEAAARRVAREVVRFYR